LDLLRHLIEAPLDVRHQQAESVPVQVAKEVGEPGVATASLEPQESILGTPEQHADVGKLARLAVLAVTQEAKAILPVLHRLISAFR
jgi:hypothetical protein